MQKENLDLATSVFAASLFMLLLVVAAFMLFRIYLKRKNKLILEKEMMSVRFEQTMLRSKLEIQEETFTYISREIHDNIGQVLSLARININTLQAEDQQKINLIDDLMAKAITDLRNLSHSLDTDIIRTTGWIKAAERLFNALGKSGTCKVRFSAEEDMPNPGNEKSIILFRMIQEILNNIIKHANATEIIFHAARDGQGINILVTDNGKGFDETLILRGAGLQNLENRANMIDANVYIHSAPGGGTSVKISVKV